MVTTILQYPATDKPSAGEHYNSYAYVFFFCFHGIIVYLHSATNVSSVTRCWVCILRWVLHVSIFLWLPRVEKYSTLVKTLQLLTTITFYTAIHSQRRRVGTNSLPRRPNITLLNSRNKSGEMKPKPTQAGGSVLSLYKRQPSLHPEQVPTSSNQTQQKRISWKKHCAPYCCSCPFFILHLLTISKHFICLKTVSSFSFEKQ